MLLFTGVSNTAAAGTITVTALSGSVTQTCPSAGRCVVTGFNPATNDRLRVTITSTDPNASGNYINNIALIYAPDSTTAVVGTNEANFTKANCLIQISASCFNPAWVSLLSPFKTLRMMDWGNTLSNLNQNWSDRSLVSWAFWDENSINDVTTGNPNGIPVEAQVAACNAQSANCWLNVPCMASPGYAQSGPRWSASILNPGLKVYAEFCNEIWNNGALTPAIQSFMASAGQSAFPVQGNLVQEIKVVHLPRSFSYLVRVRRSTTSRVLKYLLFDTWLFSCRACARGTGLVCRSECVRTRLAREQLRG